MEGQSIDIEDEVLQKMDIKIIRKIENFGNSFDYYYAKSISVDTKYIIKVIPLQNINFHKNFDSNTQYLDCELNEIKKIRSEFLWNIIEHGLDSKNLYFKLPYYDGIPVKDTISRVSDIVEKEEHIRLFFSQLINGLHQFHKRSMYHGRLVLSNLYYSNYNLKFLDYRFFDISPTIYLLSDSTSNKIKNDTSNQTHNDAEDNNNNNLDSETKSVILSGEPINSRNYPQIKNLLDNKLKLDIYCLSFILKKLMFPDQLTDINEYTVYYNISLPPNDFSDDLISFYDDIIHLLNSERPDLLSLMKNDFMKKPAPNWYRSPITITMSENVRSTLIPKLIERYGPTTTINETIKNTCPPTSKRLKSTDDVSKLNELLNYSDVEIIHNYQYIETQLRDISQSKSTSFICGDEKQISPSTESLWKAVFECLYIFKDKITSLYFRNTKLSQDIQYLKEIFLYLNNVTDLKLSGNILTSKECGNLGKYLCKMTNLVNLDISSNPICGEGLGNLSISTFQDLMSLNISNNNIDGKSINLVCKQLSTLSKLTDLDMSCNNIGGGIVEFSESFQYLPSLETLVISTNGIVDIHISSCLDNFKFLGKINFFNLDGNKITDKTLNTISQYIGHDCTMVPPISQSCIII